MSAAKCSILIIEDDPVVAGIYRSSFEKAGYAAEVALDGQAGLHRVLEKSPHVLLLDLMMPNVNGLEILRKIRAHEPCRHMLILVLTNSYLSEVAQAAVESGASSVFDKAAATPSQIIEAAGHALALIPEFASLSHAGSFVAAVPGGAPCHLDEAALAFLESAPRIMVDLRERFRMFTPETVHGARVEHLGNLAARLNSITSHAGAVGFRNIARFVSALEALVETFRLAPDQLSLSSTLTMESSIDFLGELFQTGSGSSLDLPEGPGILVVDEEGVTRRNIVRALNTVQLSAITAENPHQALAALDGRTFDLAFVDVEVSGWNGFEFCEKLRTLPKHKETAVVFLASLNRLQDHLRSRAGAEFIAKPFLAIELGVKALKHVMRQRLKANSQP